jgi:ParB/RepB/Spo0J family partition protein
MTTDDVIHDNPAGEQPPAGETSPGAVPAEEHSEPAPAAPRAMIPAGRLAAHPGNVRRDLDLSAEFVESIAANGVLVPLRITPAGDSFRVIDGHRRLTGALKAGVTEVPYDLVSDRADDEPGQYLDMINANRHRNPLTALEEAGALFAAREAGATKTRIRKEAGLTSAGLNNALSAARLSEEARARAGDLDEQLTLDELAVLAEFDGDSDAITRLTMAASCGTFEHEAELLRQARAEDAEHVLPGRPAPPPGLAAGQDGGRLEAGDAAGAGQLIDIGGNPLQDRGHPGQAGHDVRPAGVIAPGAQVNRRRETIDVQVG